MKKVLIGITLIIGCLGILYGAFHLFARHIYNTQSCAVFNIDNIELRTGIDVPEITSSDCEYNGNTKVSRFIIDTEKVDLDQYITKNKLTYNDGLYIKENDNKNSTYKVVFNKKTAELTVNLTYKDN